MDLAERLIKGLTLLKPFIERTSIDFIPDCYPLSGAPKNPSTLYVVVEPNVMEVPEDVAEKLIKLGWDCEDDFHWLCYDY